jgi:hypothetical protein
VDEQPLTGGVANAGAVVRVGDHVLRPAGPGTAGVHAFLQALAAAGFDGAPRPLGVDADGRQRLTYIEGDVALPPYPAWAQADPALAGLARLMARFHEAARAFDPSPHSWPAAVGDPAGGPVVCHNDVCLDNVVFRGGEPVALLDFDFAAPGRPVDDLAAMARMCVPVDDDANAARLGWVPADRPGRLRLVADAYGLTAAGRRLLTSGSRTCWSAPRPSSGPGWRPAIRTSWPCGRPWAASGDSRAAGPGGAPTGTGSSARCAD